MNPRAATAADPPDARRPTLLVIAGEPSGDDRAGALLQALRRQAPEIASFGIGGPQMRAAGMETLYDVEAMAVMGLVEVLRRYGFFRRVFRHLLREARARRPVAVLLVDYPGFNLRFAAAAHALGLKVIYYVCPQVWAWHRSRIPQMARHIDRLLTIFPFEARCFAGTSLRVDYVGHPLVDEAAAEWDQPEATLPWPGAPRVALLPGSRDQEIDRLLPPLWAAARRLETRHPGIGFLIAAPNDAARERLLARIAALPAGPTRWAVVAGRTRAMLRAADAAFVASGTATLEAALMLCPMLIVYRTSALTYAIARRLVRVPHIGLVNIVAGRAICPEYIQDAVRPDALADALSRLLTDATVRAAMRAELQAVNHALGDGDAAGRAAASVLDELRTN